MQLHGDVIFQAEPRAYFYKGKRYQSVTEKIEAVGFGPDFSHVNPNVMEYARQRGNAVDAALHYHYEGDLKPGSIDPAVQSYFDAAMMFDQDCPGKIVAIHPRLADRKLNVAGTPDLVRFVRGRRSVVDWKTGADNPLQTWMYWILFNLMNPRTPVYDRYGLRLNANGTYRLKQHMDPDDGPCAMAILQNNQLLIESYRPKYGQGR